MEDEAYRVYSAAEALRCGDRAAVRRALVAARVRTLALSDAYAEALASDSMRIPYQPIVNPPLWELGHVGWFQEWWIGRNLQRSLGIECDPDHARASSLLEHADTLYDSSRVAHRTRFAKEPLSRRNASSPSGGRVGWGWFWNRRDKMKNYRRCVKHETENTAQAA